MTRVGAAPVGGAGRSAADERRSSQTAWGADTLALRVCPADYKSTHSAFRHARGSHRR